MAELSIPELEKRIAANAKLLEGRPESRADDPIIRQVALDTIAEAGGAAELASDRPLALPLVCEKAQMANGWTFEAPISGNHLAEAAAILAGRYVRRLAAALEGRKPRRILDLGAGIGGFALWAAFAWPHAWIDCYERDPRVADVCRRNLPPGGAMLTGPELIGLDVRRYTLIRITDLTAMSSGSVILDSTAVLIVDAVRP